MAKLFGFAALGRPKARGLSRAVLWAGCAAILSAGAWHGVAHAAEGPANGSTANKTIALSNSYAGNSYRQAMIKDWQAVTSEAISNKVIAGATAVSANNSVTEQASDIQNLVLQGYGGIAILAASSSALNGAVRSACDAGIVVVSFAGIVTEPCAYQVNYDWESYGRQEIDYIADRLHGHGNLLEIRGIAGDTTDRDISAGAHAEIARFPGLKFVGTVYGQWTETVAQKEVAGILPSLPQIDAVVTQGGDGYGAVQAFEASGRPLPLIIMGNRQDELAWWQKQHKKTGYETFSIAATPSLSSIVFWVTQQILAGKKMPKIIHVPLLRIDQSNLDLWLAHTPEGGVADSPYSRAQVVQLIDTNIANAPLPPVPLPR